MALLQQLQLCKVTIQRMLPPDKQIPNWQQSWVLLTRHSLIKARTAIYNIKCRYNNSHKFKTPLK